MRLSKEEAIARFGLDIVEKATGAYVEPTSRLMYPGFESPSHIGKQEFAAQETVDVDGYRLQAYWYGNDIEDLDDSSLEIDVEEIW